jgi:uncharacterized protein (TIGR04255 family)
MAVSLPKKLKNDAIAEALFEIRFDSAELSEVVVGRLNDVDSWSQFKSTRLAIAQLPEAIRESDQNVRHQPTIERRADNHAIRIGAHVLSIHFNAPYPGWEHFQPVIREAIKQLFHKIPTIAVKRLGLRYINLVRPGPHLINSFDDLAIDINLKSGPLKERLNFAYVEMPDKDIIVQSKIASPEFIGGQNIPADISAAIDVDVYTPQDFVSKSAEEVESWADRAHEIEKEAFFRLLPDKIIEQLSE